MAGTLPIHSPVWIGWAGGPKADALSTLERPQRIGRALGSLAKLLGVSRKQLEIDLEAVMEHDFGADPWSRGAYSYVAAGGTSAFRTLSRPLENTLFFAGEAIDEDQASTVAGAIQSGRDAAERILAARRRS